MKSNLVSVSQKKLRALAPRAVRVVGRQKGLDVNIAAIAARVVPAASEYIRVYDEVAKRQTAQAKGMNDGRECMEELNTRLRGCLALIRSVRPEFDPSRLMGDVNHPDPFLADAHQVVDVLGEAGAAVPSDVLEAMKAALARAEQAWEAAQAMRVETQKGQEAVRAAAVVFNRELIALRRALRVLLGSSHIDYQMLRSSRVPAQDDADEEEVVSDETQGATDAPVVSATSNGASNGSAHVSTVAAA